MAGRGTEATFNGDNVWGHHRLREKPDKALCLVTPRRDRIFSRGGTVAWTASLDRRERRLGN
jgi:hypothetical protein